MRQHVIKVREGSPDLVLPGIPTGCAQEKAQSPGAQDGHTGVDGWMCRAEGGRGPATRGEAQGLSH